MKGRRLFSDADAKFRTINIAAFMESSLQFRSNGVRRMGINCDLTQSTGIPVRLRVCIALGFLLPQLSIEATAAFQDTSGAEASKAPDHMIFVRVMDTSGEPIADAKIELRYRVLMDTIEQDSTTDEAGTGIVHYPENTWYLMITIHKAGFAPKVFRAGTQFGKEVPDEIRCRLAHATSIGGEVRNSRDEPIEGARVTLIMKSRATEFYDGGSPSSPFYVGDKNSPVTDKNGRWSYDGVPRDGKVTVSITHPDYAGAGGIDSPDKDQDELREKSLVTVLKDGIRIEGQVVSEQGKAISNAIIVLSQRGLALTAKSDSRGKFRFAVIKDGFYDIAVNTESHAIEFAQIDTRKNKDPLKIVVPDGIPVRFRVVDPDEKPLRASVSFRRQGDRDVPISYLSAVPTSTNDQGFYEWLSAPHGKLMFFIFAPGFESQEFRLPEGEADSGKIVKMKREPVFAGRVIDRKTRKPIDRFVVVPFEGGASITRVVGVVGRDGKFSLPVSRVGDRQFHLMIEHPGHRTILTETSYDRTKPTDDIQIEMDSAELISGELVDARGRAAADTKLNISESASGMFSMPPMQLGMVITDESGRFQFAAPPGDFTIVVRCEDGFLLQSFRENESDLRKLQLQEWASLRGQVLQKDGRPSANSYVQIDFDKRALRIWAQMKPTDEFGNFLFDQIPPGKCTLSITPADGGKGATRKIELESGKELTENITLD